MSSQRWGNNDNRQYGGGGGGGRPRDRSSDRGGGRGGGFYGFDDKRHDERNHSRDRSRERDRSLDRSTQYSRENSPRSRSRGRSRSRSRSRSPHSDRNRNSNGRSDYPDRRTREDRHDKTMNDGPPQEYDNELFQQQEQQRQNHKWNNRKYGNNRNSTTSATRGGGGGRNESFKEIPPSSTLILRALAPTVTDRMIMDALVSFSPLTTRVVYNKATGEHRGFAFVDFPSVEHAIQVVNAFAQQPLMLEHRPVCIGYTDNNRTSHNQAQQQQPRMDWICHQCQMNNFSRRSSCFKCDTPRSENALEVPQYHHQQHQQQYASGAASSGYYQQGYGTDQQQMVDPSGNYYNSTGVAIQALEEVEIPSRILVVRMIPFEADESDLQIAFAEMEGVKDIRLIRDRVTNESRGFGFVEFMDIEKSTVALQACQTLQIQNVLVKVQYARDTRGATGVAAYAPQPVPVLNPMAAAALQQAQWSLANGYNTTQQEQQQEQPATLDDLSALLENAAAEATPHLEEPKKPWPLPFEVGGGSYVYAGDCGLYYDTDSMFYYHPQSKQYYNSYTGVYYKCLDVSNGATAESFEVYEPPLPPDNKVAEVTSTATFTTTATNCSTGTIGLTLKPQKKKPVVKPVISFGMKSSTPAGSSAAKAKVVAKPVPSGFTAVSATSNAAVNRKHAAEIAKWSQIQQEQKQNEVEQVKSKTPTTSTPPPESDTNDQPTEAPICLLCRRKFNSIEQLRKHEKLSKLHLENLAKAKRAKEATQKEEEQYRDKEKERRELQGEDPNDRSLKRYRPSSSSDTAAPSQPNPASSPAQPTTETLESGIGGKMLKMMGWKKGEGLGKDGKGITAPVAAIGSTGGETIGLGAKSLAATIDVTEVASYRDKIKQMARARYEMASKNENEN